MEHTTTILLLLYLRDTTDRENKALESECLKTCGELKALNKITR